MAGSSSSSSSATATATATAYGGSGGSASAFVNVENGCSETLAAFQLASSVRAGVSNGDHVDVAMKSCHILKRYFEKATLSTGEVFFISKEDARIYERGGEIVLPNGMTFSKPSPAPASSAAAYSKCELENGKIHLAVRFGADQAEAVAQCKAALGH